MKSVCKGMQMFNRKNVWHFSKRGYRRVLTKKTIPETIVKAEYAVRGRVALEAYEIEKKLAEDPNAFPFDSVIYCNIGNPQDLGQQPVTFGRNVLSCVLSPDIMKTEGLFEKDVYERAKVYLNEMKGSSGSYTHSQGLLTVRQEVARFIEKRDGVKGVDPARIFLSDGASPACQLALRFLLRGKRDGVMIPIPQYPLYSAGIELYGGQPIPYYLNESENWATSKEGLEESYVLARENGIKPRGVVVINPGNPTGQVLPREKMEELCAWAVENSIVLLADEVYQENIYGDDKWYSFKRIAHEMGPSIENNLELLSFHSISKGFLGECGRRGGYMEVSNAIDNEVVEQFYKVASVNLCPNVDGQISVGLMVNPPRSGDPSYPRYVSEKTAIIDSLRTRARNLVSKLNCLEGMHCWDAQGAMYAYPRITLPKQAIDNATALGLKPDLYYVLELLHATGICVVPGSGFELEHKGTYHFRTTFLPPEDQMEVVGDRLAEFHEKFLRDHGGL